MSEKIKVYYDYDIKVYYYYNLEKEKQELESELDITLYPTKDREDLLEYHVDEQFILDKIHDLVEYAESAGDFDFQKFENINDYNMVVFTEMKSSGKLEKYLCGVANDDDMSDWEELYEIVVNRLEEEDRDDEELY